MQCIRDQDMEQHLPLYLATKAKQGKARYNSNKDRDNNKARHNNGNLRLSRDQDSNKDNGGKVSRDKVVMTGKKRALETYV